MCFFDGLTTYAKTWLQFVLPLYILALVGVMIIASNYSTRVTRLLGTNAVSVLATLVLLSYTKILRILITAFSFTTLTGSQDYHSVVWLADGNIKYFQPNHAILYLVALLVLLLLGVPYTVMLTSAPRIQIGQSLSGCPLSTTGSSLCLMHTWVHTKTSIATGQECCS